MEFIAHFTNGPLEGKYTKIEGQLHYFCCLGTRQTVARYDDYNLEPTLQLVYKRQREPLFASDTIFVLEYKIEDWRV